VLLQLRIQKQEFGEAERSARELIGMAPNDAEAHNLLGVALASQGRIAEAHAEFGAALTLNPQHPDARANYLRSEQRLGTPRR
jgi:Flp pilus assembly protein TadD